ncbi:dimethylarginine dimethylaminohydrolase family protein [Rugosimonospora acidiphila]|uniref:Dimethylarginine dimethylaminohydrolase family protein n=2 Tax=Rugosimonospora acidiphila TaxID=556531 RepID=A0ABP9S0U9_9ACTN
MCPPAYFDVKYVINPWMDATTPVDAELAVKQWDRLRETLIELGHRVHVLAPQVGLPDMVYAANGAFSVDSTVFGARFRYPQRAAEAAAHQAFYARLSSEEAPGEDAGGTRAGWRFVAPTEINEGEGDFTYVPGPGLILAGYGFRTEPAAHAEAQEVLARPVISLRLVDPRFYHLDMALAVLDDTTIAYYPGAFSASAQAVLRQLFPDAVVASESDALGFGLNLVSDGRNVVLSAEASDMAARLVAAGYLPRLVELTELKKGGGSVKCCVAELRG